MTELLAVSLVTDAIGMSVANSQCVVAVALMVIVLLTSRAVHVLAERPLHRAAHGHRRSR